MSWHFNVTRITKKRKGSDYPNQMKNIKNENLIILYKYIKMDNKCNYGLIFNYSNKTENKYCISNCCIPCPIQNYLYKENNIEHDFYIINILRNISTILSLIILIKYIFKIRNTITMINENKESNLEIKKLKSEKNLNIIIICLSLSIFLFSSVSFFAIHNPKDIQCNDSITTSTQGNNIICSIQGGILIFSTFSVCVWIFVLILNFCIYNVINNFYLITDSYFNNIVIWGIPILITFIVISTNNIKYEFSNLCLVSIDNIFNMFFYPLGSIIFSSFLVLIISLIFIFLKSIYITIECKMCDEEDSYKLKIIELELNKILDIIKYHWKYIIIGFISVFTVTFYWIFYFKEIKNFRNIFHDLIDCLNNNDINICINNIKKNRPSYKLMLFSEILVSIVGMWLFIIFIDINFLKIFKLIKNIFILKKKTYLSDLL